MTNTAQFSDPEHANIIAVIDGEALGMSVDPKNSYYDLIVNGRPANDELGIGVIPPTPIADYVAPAITRGQVSAEANRRIDVGINNAGKVFRTDDSTTQKLAELVQGFKDGDVPEGGYTFATAAGDEVTYAAEDEADFIRRVANAYRAQVLEASRILQADEPITSTYGDDSNWPNYTDVI